MQGLGSAFEIRAAIPADADAVADYHHGCFTNTYSSKLLSGELEAPDPAGTRQQLDDWFLPESEFETRVAVVDGAPIGHFTVSGNQLVHLSSSQATRAGASADTCLRRPRR